MSKDAIGEQRVKDLIQRALAADTSLATHLADTSDAHDASAVSILDAANDFTATDVEGALAELQADAELFATGMGQKDVWVIECSDESTAITTGAAKKTFRAPYACTVNAVRASVNTVSSSGIPTFDINEAGTTILSTKLTIDASEKTSVTAATAAVISDPTLADDAEMTVDFDVAGTGAKGVKILMYVTRS